MVRKAIFWLHLSAGLAAGLIVAIMSITGIAIAFEAEILAWIDRDVQTVSVPADARRLSLDELDARVTTQHPDFKTTARIVPRAADLVYEFRAGRTGSLYVNPYTGNAVEPVSKPARDVLHALEEWHRWLGMEGKGREVGKLITGVANLAFLFMCITGVYMWWPRSWKPKAWRPAIWFVSHVKGRARDFNWHNVFGSWSALFLIVIVTGGVMMSFGWANKLVFRLAGEEAPTRGPNQIPGPTLTVPSPETNQIRLSRDSLLAKVTTEYPNWQSIQFDAASRPSDASATAAINVTVFEPASFQARGRTQLSVDPYRGDILQKIAFADRSVGTRARTWLRFLHTGEAFGLIGKVIATLATFGSLFLVYTGFALSYRRFFPRKVQHVQQQGAMTQANR